MAAKGKGKPATPKKFKQARADARPAAKAAFSGNKKAGLKDPTVQLTADDKKAISEMQKAGAADKKAGLTQADTEAREATRRRAIEEFRRGESGPSSTSPKSTPVVKDKPSKPRLQGTSQAAASKPAKAPSGKAAKYQVGRAAGKTPAAAAKEANPRLFVNKPDKTMGEISKTVTDEMRRADKNKALSYSARGTLDRNNSLGKNRNSKVEKSETKSKVKKPSSRGGSGVGKSVAIRPDAVISPKTGKEVAIRGKGTVATPSTKGGAPAVREAKVTVIPRVEASKPKFTKSRKVGKGLLGTAVAAEGLSLLKGSTDKDLKELDRLKAKLAKAQGKTYKPGFWGNFKADAAGELSQLGSLATMGLIGKTRRQYMDELNTKIAKASPKKPSAPKATIGGMPGAGIAKAQAGVQGSTGVKKPQIPAGGPSGGSAAGKAPSAKTVAPGGLYTVQKGDTLWDIAKRHNVTLKQVRDANPVFKENPKYKNGSMIWSGTKVRIPGK